MSSTEATIATGADGVLPICHHCGAPVPAGALWQVRILGLPRAMCCAGCQAVAEAIVASGLEDFYSRRAAPHARRWREVLPNRTTPDPSIAQAVRDGDSPAAVIDDPLWQAGRVAARADEREAVLAVSAMHCAACAWLIESRLAALPGVLAVRVIYATGRLRVRWREGAHTDAVTAQGDRLTQLSAIIEAVRALGYPAVPFDDLAAQTALRREQRESLWRLFIAALGMMQVMMYAVPAYLAEPGDLDGRDALLMNWAGFVLTLPVMIWSAAPFLQGAWRDLRQRRLGMDVPVALGLMSAFVASTVALFAGGAVYFDSITMFVFFLLAARYLEWLARARAGHWIDALAATAPEPAARLIDHPASMAVEAVAPERLRPGDRVLVSRAAAVPVDGVLVSAVAALDESLLTGESHPVSRRQGDRLMAGAVNLAGPVVVEVVHEQAAGTRSGLQQLVERGLAARPWIQRLADRHASAFTLIVLSAASLTAFFTWPAGPAAALQRAIAVLVVTCPCALALATPLALLAANARLAGAGVLATSAQALERLARIDWVVFDKTGTLTDGQMSLQSVRLLADLDRTAVLGLAAALEAGAAHPVARAISVAWAGEGVGSAPMAHGLREGDGGVSGRVGDDLLKLGSPDFVGPAPEAPERALLAQRLEVSDQLVLILADSVRWLAMLEFADRVRSEAHDVVRSLARQGVRSALFSGDRPASVAAVATLLEIGSVRAGLDPAGKQTALRELQQRGLRVAMVGDGFNDAPVLAQSDCAISLAGATSMARLQADLILLEDKLGGVPEAIQVARAARRVIRQNLIWALAYNLGGIPAAALGWVPPWVAGLGMAASSALVVLNSVRLLPRKG